MNILSAGALAAYWSTPEITANLVIFFNMLGALLLGLVVGYERSYHGRAAGMRTYGLVCMASTALTVISGYSGFWYGGHAGLLFSPDPTRVVQGIVTGIGFLGAGVIMKEGFSISGLTTAASIWAASAIGVMVGVGFYAAAMLLALMSASCMVLVSRLENWLPIRQAVAITLQFEKDFVPNEEALRRMALKRGYEIAGSSIKVDFKDGKPKWHFIAVALGKKNQTKITELASQITLFEGVESFHLSHARN